MSNSKFWIVALILVVVASLGCSTSIGVSLSTADETVQKSFEVGASPRVVVETFNGKVQVTTDAAPTVSVSVTKRGSGNTQAAAQDDLKNIEVTMTQDGGAVRVVARRINRASNWGNSGASATLKVPSGAVLELRSSNGTVTVLGQTGDVTINTSNGKISVDGSRGQLKLDTSNGSIEASADQAVVNARTSNGAITFKGALAQGNHTLRTSNGKITLTLPASASFKLDAETSNGKVSSDFAVTRTGGSRDSELRGTVGDNPATSIELRTSNGGIELRKN
jgi:DUF4097 and DUF4098 domain-containing protein YvlB